MVSGSDLWLNTPLKPLEASGTSGMKAALNAVPHFSVLDGWWIEGHVEGVTGWSIGDTYDVESNPEKEVNSMYDKLERDLVPMFYHDQEAYSRVDARGNILERIFIQYAADALTVPCQRLPGGRIETRNSKYQE